MKFSEFPYQRPDYEQLMSRISELTRQFQSAQTADEQLAILKQLEQLRIELRTSVQIATIRYTVDTRDAFYSAEEEYNEQMARWWMKSCRNLTRPWSPPPSARS